MKEKIEANIQKNNFELITPYLSCDKPITIKCLMCLESKTLKQAKNCLGNIPCKKCANYTWRKYYLENVIEICNKNQVSFLDDYYHNIQEKHNFQCRNGHVWLDSFGELSRKFRKGTNGCQLCTYEKLRMPEEVIKNRLLENGVLLNSPYTNSHQKHKLECSGCHHHWIAIVDPIINRGVGCPKCNLYLNEKLVGIYIQELLTPSTIKPHFRLCENIYHDDKLIRKYLFIDYKVDYLGKTIFIEYNGIQHYKPTFFKKQNPNTDIKNKFAEQQIRDKWLTEYCLLNNIILISIDGRRYTKEKTKSYLKTEFMSNGLIPLQAP